MEEKNTNKFYDVLDKIVDSYNKTPHRALKGLAPNEINNKNEKWVWYNMYVTKSNTKRKNIKYAYKIGQKVRITKIKNLMTREMNPRWTREIFTIVNRFTRDGIEQYKIEDYHKQILLGSFHKEELQKVDVDKNFKYKIEKILDTRGKGKNEEYKVRYLDLDKRFDEWIPKKNIYDV